MRTCGLALPRGSNFPSSCLEAVPKHQDAYHPSRAKTEVNLGGSFQRAWDNGHKKVNDSRCWEPGWPTGPRNTHPPVLVLLVQVCGTQSKYFSLGLGFPICNGPRTL